MLKLCLHVDAISASTSIMSLLLASSFAIIMHSSTVLLTKSTTNVSLSTHAATGAGSAVGHIRATW